MFCIAYVMLKNRWFRPSATKLKLKLFDIDKNRHSIRIKTKNLLNKLNKLGYKNITSKHNYTQFTQKSLLIPID